jgi:Zn-finger nucleic acid-binding protein
VPIEWCVNCRGAWLDLFQLDLILHRSRPPEPAAPRLDDEGSGTEVPATPVRPRRKK